jgi:Animal haem peroxidase
MTTAQDTATRLSRRRFLGAGAGAAGAIALGPAAELSRAATLAGRGRGAALPAIPPDRFGRIFRLPGFAEATSKIEGALVDLGRPGGLLDARDALDRGPKDLIVDPSLSVRNPNNPTHTAGTTFLGQFIDHDLTFDAGSHLAHPTKPEAARNFRTPALDLDSVYGQGPVADQALYDPADMAKLKLESGGLFEDLPRTEDGRAIIADPRNDENLIIAGLQAAVIRFHNNAVDRVRADGAATRAQAFAQARRLTTWHYQWIVVHEFLPLVVGSAMVEDVLRRGSRYYRPKGGPFIPVDFQGAAYRFGHSMVRPSYRANLQGDNGKPFFALIFDPSQAGKPDPDDLLGGVRARRRFVGWQTFFDFGDGEVKPNKLIDTKLSTPLFNLPLGAIASHDTPTSLPQRNLLRQLTWSLPSGQSIARAMRVPPLAPSDLSELREYAHFDRSTPLWYYVLKEAELMADGLRLGPVGGRIVAEVILGVLRMDGGSYFHARPAWQPTLPSRGAAADFRMVDFLTFAGVDPKSRGQ